MAHSRWDLDPDPRSQILTINSIRIKIQPGHELVYRCSSDGNMDQGSNSDTNPDLDMTGFGIRMERGEQIRAAFGDLW